MITVEKISKKFDEAVVFDEFDYVFELGKSYALIGPSGSGKSTLLNMIGKLESPDSGTLKIDTKALSTIKEQVYFRDYLGYLFQNYGLIDNESVLNNLLLAFVGKKVSKAGKKSQIITALEKVGLGEIPLKRNIFSLSGGEQQRVALAKLILKNPRIILADEPTGALDPSTGDRIADLLLELLDETKTIVIATHNPEVWEKCDVILDLRTV
ncbi:MAG: ATP-binding cassette domain-containing protein [Streptococcaceae bacterium]|jgi:putative ABC transport system ATP-binding protein|nr:ATP-binding cassette domain-containing protein [Streptococcaceae bacterium]